MKLQPWTARLAGFLLVAFCCSMAGQPIGAEEKAGDLPLVYDTDFDSDEGWAPTDAKAWKVMDVEGGKAYSLFAKSKYTPPHRSPENIALLKDVVVGDFILEAKVQSTGRDYGHRDLCFVFGYQDPAHFYYVHLARNADDHANQIFIVNGKPRTKISLTTTRGTPWDDNWHTVRVRRDTKSGDIEIYFDDLKQAVMTARDKTFAWGQIGIGSFDDTGNFDRLTLHGASRVKTAD